MQPWRSSSYLHTFIPPYLHTAAALGGPPSHPTPEGTPLQNSGAELFSLVHFVAPATYDAAALFEEALAADAGAARPLWAPLLLRRLKADHVTLPSKVEGAFYLACTPRAHRVHTACTPRAHRVHAALQVEATLYVPLTPLQREWYRAVLERDASQLGAAL